MNMNTSTFKSYCLCFCLITLCFWTPTYAAEQDNKTRAIENPNMIQLSSEMIEQDVALLKEAYSRIHPGYTRYAKLEALEAAWDEIIIKSKRQDGMTLANFYLYVQDALTKIRCDHTKANLPKSIAQRRKQQAVYLPFEWRWLENRAIVTQVPQGSPLAVNDEIMSIDGRKISEIVADVRDYTPVDGYTEWAKDTGVGASYEFMGGAVDHFGDLLWNYKAQATIEFVNSASTLQTAQVSRVTHPEWLAIISTKDETGKALSNNFKDAVYFEQIDERTALLRVDTFVNYREPVKPEDIYTPIFKALKQNNTQTLILDLRNNGGGSSDAMLGLFANLIQKKTSFIKDMTVATLDHDGLEDYLWSWDKRVINPNRLGFSSNDDGTYSLRSWFSDELSMIKPEQYAFNGKVIALTSNSNGSASTNLLSVLKAKGRVTIVGEKTGGSAQGPNGGVLITLRLPNSNITTRIPVFKYSNNVKSFEFGMGLTPDVYAPMTVNALVNKQDPALESALSSL